MKSLDEFARAASEQRADIRIKPRTSPEEDFLQPDALLQTPLIAFCLLIMAYATRTGVDARHTASVTSAIFATCFAGLGDARGRLTWSAAMRLKCADALAEIELLGLVRVEGQPRHIFLSDKGKDVIAYVLRAPATEVGALALQLRRAYEDVQVRGLTLL